MYTKAEQIIHAVKRYRALYDISHGDYCKINVKERIWKTIAENLEIESGQEARDQWFRLRDSHRIALRRQERKRQKDPDAQIKPWIYQKQMEFLLPYMSSIGSTDIVVDGEEEEEEEEEGCIDEPEVIVLEDDFFNSTSNKDGKTSFDHSYNIHLAPPLKKRKRLSKYEILKERVENGLAVTDLSEILHPKTQRVLSSVYYSELTDVVSGVQRQRELNKTLESDETDVSSKLIMQNVLKVIDKTEVMSHPKHPRLVEIERPPDVPPRPKVQVVTPHQKFQTQEESQPKIQRVLRSATQQKKVNVPCSEVPGILKQGKRSIFEALPGFSKQNEGFSEVPGKLQQGKQCSEVPERLQQGKQKGGCSEVPGKSQQGKQCSEVPERLQKGKQKGGFSEVPGKLQQGKQCSEVPERLKQQKRVSFVPEEEESLETEVYSMNDSDSEEVMLEFSGEFPTQVKREKPQKPSKYDTLPNGIDVSSSNSQSETSESVTEKSKDALKLFFDSMYNLTNAMPHHFQAKIRRKLFEAVMEAEEEIYSNPAESVKFCGNNALS